jgi:hypothetical protein
MDRGISFLYPLGLTINDDKETAYAFLTSHDTLIGLDGLFSSFVAWLITSLKSPFTFFPIVSLEAGSLRTAQKSLRQISRSACQKHLSISSTPKRACYRITAQVVCFWRAGRCSWEDIDSWPAGQRRVGEWHALYGDLGCGRPCNPVKKLGGFGRSQL